MDASRSLLSCCTDERAENSFYVDSEIVEAAAIHASTSDGFTASVTCLTKLLKTSEAEALGVVVVVVVVVVEDDAILRFLKKQPITSETHASIIQSCG